MTKFFWPSAALTLLAGSCMLNADEARVRNIENRITALENSKSGCCIINPSARSYDPECWGFYVKIDPIIWQAHGGGSAIVTDAGSSTFFNNSTTNDVKNLNYDWDWGFRLGVGLNTAHDAWDVLVQWTYWCSDAKLKKSVDAPSVLFPRIGHPDIFDGVDFDGTSLFRVVAENEFHLNLLDLENGRDFFVSQYLTLRPFAGLRSAWLKQELDIKYRDLQNINATLSPNNRVDISEVNRYWGLGIRGGLDMEWGLGCGWGIFSNYATSLLYNYFAVRNKLEGAIDEGPKTTLYDVRNFYHYGTSITDMQIGLRYDWVSCDECYHIGLDLGWEHHYFPGQQQFMLFVDDTMPADFINYQGDFATQGYFLKVRVDF